MKAFKTKEFKISNCILLNHEKSYRKILKKLKNKGKKVKDSVLYLLEFHNGASLCLKSISSLLCISIVKCENKCVFETHVHDLSFYILDYTFVLP